MRSRSYLLSALLGLVLLALGGCAEPPQRVESEGGVVIVPALRDYCARYPDECEAVTR